MQLQLGVAMLARRRTLAPRAFVDRVASSYRRDVEGSFDRRRVGVAVTLK
ncbi:MAG TPA: hypothetical protein VGZ68_04355 [Acidimicrobiales bacterium]|nr:hypothetical protein [Acidimicrobiales bacterium]